MTPSATRRRRRNCEAAMIDGCQIVILRMWRQRRDLIKKSRRQLKRSSSRALPSLHSSRAKQKEIEKRRRESDA